MVKKAMARLVTVMIMSMMGVGFCRDVDAARRHPKEKELSQIKDQLRVMTDRLTELLSPKGRPATGQRVKSRSHTWVGGASVRKVKKRAEQSKDGAFKGRKQVLRSPGRVPRQRSSLMVRSTRGDGGSDARERGGADGSATATSTVQSSGSGTQQRARTPLVTKVGAESAVPKPTAVPRSRAVMRKVEAPPLAKAKEDTGKISELEKRLADAAEALEAIRGEKSELEKQLSDATEAAGRTKAGLEERLREAAAALEDAERVTGELTQTLETYDQVLADNAPNVDFEDDDELKAEFIAQALGELRGRLGYQEMPEGEAADVDPDGEIAAGNARAGAAMAQLKEDAAAALKKAEEAGRDDSGGPAV